MATPETLLKNRVVRYLADLRRGGHPICWRRVSYSPVRGDPDIVVCFHGRMIQMELKSSRGVVSAAQQYRLDEWESAGAVVGVVRSVHDAYKLLRVSLSDSKDLKVVQAPVSKKVR